MKLRKRRGEERKKKKEEERVLPSVDTVRMIFLFLMALHLNSYRIRRIAATISTLELGRGTSHAPMNCFREDKKFVAREFF